MDVLARIAALRAIQRNEVRVFIPPGGAIHADDSAASFLSRSGMPSEYKKPVPKSPRP
jgi:hypothetical protein